MTTQVNWLADFNRRLPILVQHLRAKGFNIGTDTLLNVRLLLQRLEKIGQLPEKPEQMMAYIQPLVCSSAEQQVEFASIYQYWWNGEVSSVANEQIIQKQGNVKQLNFSDSNKKAFSRYVIAATIGFLVLVSVVVSSLMSQSPIETSPQERVSTPDKTSPQESVSASDKTSPQESVSASDKTSPQERVSTSDKTSPQARVSTSDKTSPQERVSTSDKTSPQERVSTADNTSPSSTHFTESKTTSDAALQIPIRPIPLRNDYLPLTLDEQGRKQQQLIQKIISWLPVALLASVWGFYYLRRRYYLNKHKADKNSPLQYLASPHNRLQPFSWTNLTGGLGRGRFVSSRRYDINKTVDASLRKGGMFVPVYGLKRKAVSILILVDRYHMEDMQGELAGMLARQLRADGILVYDYEFNQDPRFCRSRYRNKHTQPLKNILSQHSDAHLLFIGDGHALFHPFRGEFFHWAKAAFATMQNKVLLTTNNRQWGNYEAQLSWQLGFNVAPFSSDGIQAVHLWLANQWLVNQQESERTSGYAKEQAQAQAITIEGRWFPHVQAPLPEMIHHDYDQWLSSTPTQDYNFQALAVQLRLYCGSKGLELIAASAIYPEILPKLTAILNTQLFPKESAREKEIRLLRLNQLPWFRFARLPDYLRKDLIAFLAEQRLQDIVQLYTTIFHQLSLTPNRVGALARFASQTARKPFDVKQWLKHIPDNSRWADRIFVDVMLNYQKNRGILFMPEKLAKLLRGSSMISPSKISRSGISRYGVGVAVPLCVAILLSHGLNMAWSPFIAPKIESDLLQGMFKRNGQYQVQLLVNEHTKPLASQVQAQLEAFGFTIQMQQQGELANSENIVSENDTRQQGNSLMYGQGAERQAQHILSLMQHLSDNGFTRPNNQLPDNAIVLRLNAPARAGSVFSDKLIQSLPDDFTQHLQQETKQKEAGQKETAQESLFIETASSVLEPTMVAIPAGEFLMGSTQLDVDKGLAFIDELPQHRVTIQAFYLSATQVLFAQYKVFAEETGRFMPDHGGWGLDNRPITNLSWNDANAYTQWLSQQTNKNYRLPTEAEWEYAARAGTQTAFSTGDCLSATQANIDDRDGVGECGTSDIYYGTYVDVASYQANPFGLYDMHGNVWEWTADCWHDNYQNAPIDGRAWLDKNGEECGARVIRGGSYFSPPLVARSASRRRSDNIGTAGFRIARTD